MDSDEAPVVDHTFTESLSRIEVYAQGGRDRIDIASDVTSPAFVFGGNSGDIVHAGGGPAVLVGGAGRDELHGGSAPAILIGGRGADELEGGSGADLLIGGGTTFDANLTALRAILAEWARTDIGYADKVAHLTGASSGGLNGPYLLNASTLVEDDRDDELDGRPGGGNLY